MEEIPKLESITSTLAGVVDGVGALQSLSAQAETRDYQISDYTQNTMNNLAQRMIDYREQSYYEYNDLVSRITAISGGGSEQPCGISLGDPPCPPEGGDGFTAIDSQNLQTVSTTSQEIASGVRSLGYGLDDVESAVKNVDRSVEYVEDAVDSMRSALSDDLYYTSGQLGEKLDAINTTLQSGSGGSGDDDTATNEKLDGIKGALDRISDTSGFADDLAQGTAQGKSDLNELLDGYNADTMLTDRFKAITDEAELTMKNSGLSKFSDPSKFINDSGMVKPESFDDLVSFAQRQPCSPYQMTIRGNSYQMDLCPYAADSSSILTYVFAVLTAIFCFVMISQTLINERLS